MLLVDKARHWPMLKRVVEPNWIIGPGIDELTDHPGLGRRLRKANKRIHVWTVNTDEQLQTCLDLGVEAVITDRPAYLLEKLGVSIPAALGKRSRTKTRETAAANDFEGQVGPRQPCPCGSGRRYKACHGDPSSCSPRRTSAVRSRESRPSVT